jgi:hypothetical protein
MSDEPNSITLLGLNALRAEGVASPGPYVAKMADATPVGSFESLADAVSWLTKAVDEGILAKRLNIYSAKNELVWSEPASPSGELREAALIANAKRIFVQSEIQVDGDDYPLAPL